MKESTYISAVVYVHNSERAIVEFLLKIDNLLHKKFQSYEIILVNDKSTDNTVDRVFEVKDKMQGNVTIISLSEKHGLERALLAGIDISIGDYIFEIESVAIDYPLEIIYDMFKTSIQEGYDIVFAVPDISNNLWHRIHNRILANLLNKKISFQRNKLRLVSRRALYALTDWQNKILDRSILYKLTGFNWSSITYNSNNTKDYNVKKGLKLFQILMLYTKFFDRLPYILSLMFLSVGLISILFNRNNVVLFTILIGFSSILFTLGFIYRALTIIVREQMNSQLYKVNDIKRLNRY
jgi:dolichol-phosphate mannosyltransferase